MGSKGPSDSTIAAEQQNAASQTQIAQQQNTRAQQTFDVSFPGFKTAEQYYATLASGDEGAIQRATAPATQQIAASAEQEKENLKDTMPRGGAADLAQEEVDIGKSSQIGGLEANAYLSAFPALAQLGGTGIGLSTNEVATAIQAFSGAGQMEAATANQQEAAKSSQLGFISALGGAAAQGFAAA